MKNTSIVFIAFFLSLVSCTQSENQDLDVYLLIGQSNMAGRGTMIENDTAIIENVFLLNSEGEPEPAANPLNKYSTIRKKIELQQVGLGYSFSQELVKKTGRKILLVVNARGGSSIDSWIKGANDNYYNESVMRAKKAMRYGKLKAILWHQGESNSSDPESYADKFVSMALNLRAELDDVPIVIGEIAQWHKNAKLFNPVVNKIPTMLPNCYVVKSEDASPLIDTSDPHFSRDGQILLGQRYANTLLEIKY